MYTYSQTNGTLMRGGILQGMGYSGIGTCKNAPDFQCVANQGPLPRGMYTILPPVNSPTHGPLAFPLEPDPGNQMFGRSGFMIHGDSSEHPGQASHGCIIMGRAIRETIQSNLGVDDILEVVA